MPAVSFCAWCLPQVMSRVSAMIDSTGHTSNDVPPTPGGNRDLPDRDHPVPATRRKYWRFIATLAAIFTILTGLGITPPRQASPAPQATIPIACFYSVRFRDVERSGTERSRMSIKSWQLEEFVVVVKRTCQQTTSSHPVARSSGEPHPTPSQFRSNGASTSAGAGCETPRATSRPQPRL